MNITTIEISDETAERFVSFQKHWDLFNTLDKYGIISMKSGKITININEGVVVNIIKEEKVFSR